MAYRPIAEDDASIVVMLDQGVRVGERAGLAVLSSSRSPSSQG